MEEREEKKKEKKFGQQRIPSPYITQILSNNTPKSQPNLSPNVAPFRALRHRGQIRMERVPSEQAWMDTTAFCSEITAVLQNMSMPVPSPSTSIPVAWLNAVL
ncbi:Polycomb group protein FIE1 [Fusarium oxysporum f. sp. albedinis]|nr:Polycomb group protein FIE1 [Fusarium oxysporum f. sp. albedinis]